jgi:hypothetical protein
MTDIVLAPFGGSAAPVARWPLGWGLCLSLALSSGLWGLIGYALSGLA